MYPVKPTLICVTCSAFNINNNFFHLMLYLHVTIRQLNYREVLAPIRYGLTCTNKVQLWQTLGVIPSLGRLALHSKALPVGTFPLLCSILQNWKQKYFPKGNRIIRVQHKIESVVSYDASVIVDWVIATSQG